MAMMDGLIRKLNGEEEDPAPLGMPGTPQNANTGVAGTIAQFSAPPLGAGGPLQDGPAAPRNSTRLMEGDAGKLADVGHAAKSPKYDFLQLANQGKYGYDQLGDMLKELQGGPNAAHWQGWTADKDKLRFAGDKSQLGQAWDGVTEVDAVGGYNSGNPQGFRWGAGSDGSGPGQPAPQGGGMSLAPMLQADPSANIQSALGKFGQAQDGGFLAKLIAQLRGGQA
jgi:hypothetical protein